MMHRRKLFALVLLLAVAALAKAQPDIRLRKRDRKRDVELVTTSGTLVLRLYDSTPLHRDNFLRLVKARFYDSILFHRVIQSFMIQAGDAATKRGAQGPPAPGGLTNYTIPAEIRTGLFHKKGVLAAARTGDQVNPEKRSSGTQFYIVQGRQFTDASLDSVETYRLQGRKLPPEHRAVYKTTGGTPHLDGNYTIFGEVVQGLAVVDSIAAVPTTRQPPDRPVQDVRIVRARLVKRPKR